jgi:hypothetical protein
MDEHKQLIKERFESLPKALQEYISSDVWSSKISQICTQNNIQEDIRVGIENEVFFVLIGLEPPKDLKDNIVRETGLEDGVARRIADTVNGSVFSPVMNYIKDLWKEEQATETKQSKVGDSFTQAIVNQARAMQLIGEAPINLPTQETAQHATTYKPGTDPYREPIE